MTHNLQRPLARYLSSFAYRLSGEHPVSLNEDISFLDRPRLTADPLSTRSPSLGLLYALEKKVLRTGFEDPSRIAGEIPIALLSEGSATGTRVWFSMLDRSAARMLVLGGPMMTLRGVLRVVAVGDRAVWSLKKTFHRTTEQSGETAASVQ